MWKLFFSFITDNFITSCGDKQQGGKDVQSFLQICITMPFTPFSAFIACTACALLYETLFSDHVKKINMPILSWLVKNLAVVPLSHLTILCRWAYELPFDYSGFICTNTNKVQASLGRVQTLGKLKREIALSILSIKSLPLPRSLNI